MLTNPFTKTLTNAELLQAGLPKALQKSLNEFNEAYGELKPNSIAVLIPAYNEEDSLLGVIKRVPPEVAGLKTNLIVINDGSTDNTELVAKSIGAMVLNMSTNSGQGAALKAGYLLSLQNNVRYVAVVDADGQWDPSDLEEMITPLIKNKADFCQGSRTLGSTEVNDKFRNLGVSFFTWLVTFLLRQHVGDTSSGYRTYRKEVLEKVRLSQHQYQSSEILISAISAGARLHEHPVKMSPRTAGESKKANNWKYGLLYLRAVLNTITRDRIIPQIFALLHR